MHILVPQSFNKDVNYDSNREKNHILFIGSVHPRKNLIIFLESVALLKDLNLKISIVCRISESVYKDTFKYLINKLELNNVSFYESIPTESLDILYNKASLFVFPTLIEGFGAPPAEAQAHSLPVIASDIPVCHEVLGDSFIYFNPLSSFDLSEKIRFLLDENNTDIVAKLIKKGKENVKKYDLNSIVTKQFEIYNQLN